MMIIMPKLLASRKTRNYNSIKQGHDHFDGALDRGLTLEDRRKSRDRIYNVELSCSNCRYKFNVNITSALKGTVCPKCGKHIQANPKERNYKAVKVDSFKSRRQSFRIRPL